MSTEGDIEFTLSIHDLNPMNKLSTHQNICCDGIFLSDLIKIRVS